MLTLQDLGRLLDVVLVGGMNGHQDPTGPDGVVEGQVPVLFEAHPGHAAHHAAHARARHRTRSNGSQDACAHHRAHPRDGKRGHTSHGAEGASGGDCRWLPAWPVPETGRRASTLAPIDAAAASENAPSLAEVVGELEADGYPGQMAARPGGRLMCFTCHSESPAPEVEVHTLRRTEGASDPDDMLAVVALTCPRCGARATVVLGYGPEAGEDDAEVLLHLARPDTA